MSETRNMIMEYLGMRFNNKQKQRFLTTTVHKFIKMDYSEKEMTVDKKKLQNSEYLNLYIGNFATADRIITTYYDTPAKAVLPIHYKVGNSRNNYYVNLVSTVLPLSMYFIFEIAMLWFLLIPLFQTHNSFKMMFAVAIGAFLVYINTKIIHGIPKIHHFVRNTLSIIFMVDMCKKMTTQQRKKTVFAFTDNGCENRNGQNMLADYMKQSNSRAKVIHLDCIADLSAPVIYANSRIIKRLESQDKDIVLKSIDGLDYAHIDKKDIFITNGIINRGSVEVVSEKSVEKNFDIDVVEKNFQLLQDEIISLA